MREVKILVTTKQAVTATVFTPVRNPAGVLVIHSATATPQGFYRGFAQYAAQAGYVALTYDYRGTGKSGAAKENSKLRMRDWIQEDVQAVAKWAAEHYPNLPHFAVGHSVGGHALVLDYGTEKLSGAVIVASHVAAIRTIEPLAERLRVMAILNVLGPVVSRAAGFMPGSRLGLGEDIPTAAMREWSRWTTKRNYFFDDPSMNAAARAANMTVPVLALGAGDDPWASPKQMDQLTEHLQAADVRRMTLTPEQLGAKTVGHHGLMRRGVGEAAWAQLFEWIGSLNPVRN